MHILMLLANPFRPDPRVAREAQALVESGHRVTIIAWDREAEGEFPLCEERDGYTIERVQDVRSKYGAGVRQVLSIPRFWVAAIRKVKTVIPDVVHCHDLDTLAAGWWLKRVIKLPLVYDAHEDYPALMSLYLPKAMVAFLKILERFLLRRVDYTITASSVLADKYRKDGVGPIITIGNYQSLGDYDQLRPDQIDSMRQSIGIEPGKFILAYVGTFSLNRELLPLISAVKSETDVQLLIWGDGHQREDIEQAIKQVPNARYMGWASPEKVPEYFYLSDVIYYCLKTDYPGAVYNAPNALSSAMAAGKPVIANDMGDLGRIVRKTGCGVLLAEVFTETIRTAIRKLRNEELREELGQAGRRAAEREFNWSTAKQSLDLMYRQILEMD
jgi:glycosyltransferase involved in cell wall biosynthesis